MASSLKSKTRCVGSGSHKSFVYLRLWTGLPRMNTATHGHVGNRKQHQNSEYTSISTRLATIDRERGRGAYRSSATISVHARSCRVGDLQEPVPFHSGRDGRGAAAHSLFSQH